MIRDTLEMCDFQAIFRPLTFDESLATLPQCQTFQSSATIIKNSNLALLRLAIMTDGSSSLGFCEGSQSTQNTQESDEVSYITSREGSSSGSESYPCDDGRLLKQSERIAAICTGYEVTGADVYELLNGILSPSMRSFCITELCKRSDVITGLGAMLWNTPSLIQVLLLELMTLYPLLNPPRLSREHLHHISSILALLQQVVLDNSVKDAFLDSRAQFYVIPFLVAEGKSRDIENLRVCLLSFFATIVQKAGRNVEQMEQSLDLLHSDVLYFTIRAVQCCCTDVGKSLAMLVLNRILLSDKLLQFIAQSRERFHDIAFAIGCLVKNITQKLPSLAHVLRDPSSTFIHQRQFACGRYEKLIQVLIYAVRTYLRLCDNKLMCDALRICMIAELMDRSLLYQYPNVELQRALMELWNKLSQEATMLIISQHP